MAFSDTSAAARNAQALAAGAKPGQTATFEDGSSIKVQEPAAAASAAAAAAAAPPSGGGTANEQPPGGGKSKYLGNHTYTTEAGHMIEIDNSPGDRRIHVYHASGTFIEIKDDGARITKVVAKDQEYLEKGKDQKITGTFNLSVDGDVFVHVTGSMKQEVKGDYELVVHGNYRIKSAGNHLQETGGDERVQVNGKTSHRSAGDREHITGGSSMETVGADRNVTTTGNNIDMTGGNSVSMTGGEHAISSGGTVGIGGAEVGIASTGEMNLKALGGNLTAVAPEIHLNP